MLVQHAVTDSLDAILEIESHRAAARVHKLSDKIIPDEIGLELTGPIDNPRFVLNDAHNFACPRFIDIENRVMNEDTSEGKPFQQGCELLLKCLRRQIAH